MVKGRKKKMGDNMALTIVQLVGGTIGFLSLIVYLIVRREP